MTKVAIVGSGAEKYTAIQANAVKDVMRMQLLDKNDILVSGHSIMRGVDIWAEEVATELGCVQEIKIPEVEQWEDWICKEGHICEADLNPNTQYNTSNDIIHCRFSDSHKHKGYRSRNLDIASDCEECYVIITRNYPPSYSGKRFTYCYHCHVSNHLKSGGCWVGQKVLAMQKPATWLVVEDDGTITGLSK